VSQAWPEISLEQVQQPRGVTGFEISSLGFVLDWWEEFGYGTANLCVVTDMLIVSKKGLVRLTAAHGSWRSLIQMIRHFTAVPIFVASIDAVRSFVCGLGQGCCF
jgi:hypothetical protein